MEIISLKSFVVLTLATSILLASRSVCADESVISNLCDREHYDEYLKVCSDIRGLAAPAGTVVASLASFVAFLITAHRTPQRGETKGCQLLRATAMGFQHIPKVQNSKMYKLPQLMPLRYCSFFEEFRSVEPVANLPLRLGWNFDGAISRRIPNLPQRFRRAAVKSIMGSMVCLPQRLLKSPSAEHPSYPMGSQPRELQAADEGKSSKSDVKTSEFLGLEPLNVFCIRLTGPLKSGRELALQGLELMAELPPQPEFPALAQLSPAGSLPRAARREAGPIPPQQDFLILMERFNSAIAGAPERMFF
ncbi:pro-FMRFamide-related neuropeptide VF [Antechinus flavipes]|uniref:pro-FMRFamide-related neuropeptide VF n=1 Tax=Antechinus flavipes TaxID=38775 RepID=UPI0022357583|nr:pro-FMRFamide-related neuropeptide VF [Antechinus flavipes]